MPKSSFIQTLIRTFPTSFGGEHTGQEFSATGFLPMLELNLAIVTAWCNEMIATARPNLVNALVSRCSLRFAMFKASDCHSWPLGSTDLQRVWNYEIPSAWHEHLVPIHIRWVIPVPTGFSGTVLTSFTAPCNRNKENKFTCILGKTNSCAMVTAKWVNGDRMRTNGFVGSICHVYVSLGYKNVSHLSVGLMERKWTLKQSLFLSFFFFLVG